MSRNSRSFTGTALLAALMSIPAMAHAQTSSAEKSLMNRVSPDPQSQIGEHQPVSTRGAGDQSLASRALQGTVGAIQFTGWDMERHIPVLRPRNRRCSASRRDRRPATRTDTPVGGRSASQQPPLQGWSGLPSRRKAFRFRIPASAPGSEPECLWEPRWLPSRAHAERQSVCGRRSGGEQWPRNSAGLFLWGTRPEPAGLTSSPRSRRLHPEESAKRLLRSRRKPECYRLGSG